MWGPGTGRGRDSRLQRSWLHVTGIWSPRNLPQGAAVVFTPAAVRLNTDCKGHVLSGGPQWLFQPHREAEKGGEHAREVGEGRLVGSDRLGSARGTRGFTPGGESTFQQPDRKGEGWWQMRGGGQGCRGPFQRPPVGRGSLCDLGKAGRGHAMQEGQATDFLNPDGSITRQRWQRPAHGGPVLLGRAVLMPTASV